MSETVVAAGLLLCPFCGKRPVSEWVSAEVAGSEDCGYWFIGCVHCTAAAIAEDSEQESAAKWNARVEPFRPVPYDEVVTALRHAHYTGEPAHEAAWYKASKDVLARVDAGQVEKP